MKNCVTRFHAEVGTAAFLRDLGKKAVSSQAKGERECAERIFGLMQTWGVYFENHKGVLPEYTKNFEALRGQGYTFPPPAGNQAFQPNYVPPPPRPTGGGGGFQRGGGAGGRDPYLFGGGAARQQGGRGQMNPALAGVDLSTVPVGELYFGEPQSGMNVVDGQAIASASDAYAMFQEQQHAAQRAGGVGGGGQGGGGYLFSAPESRAQVEARQAAAAPPSHSSVKTLTLGIHQQTRVCTEMVDAALAAGGVSGDAALREMVSELQAMHSSAANMAGLVEDETQLMDLLGTRLFALNCLP